MVAQVHSNWNIILKELSRWIQLYRGGVGFVNSTKAD